MQSMAMLLWLAIALVAVVPWWSMGDVRTALPTAVPHPHPLQPYHWPTVANSALAGILRGLFPTASASSLEAITTLEQAFAAQFQSKVRPIIFHGLVVYGQAVAHAILAWAATERRKFICKEKE
jgi:hypothetical protein